MNPVATLRVGRHDRRHGELAPSVSDRDDVPGIPPSDPADPQAFPGEHAAGRRRKARRLDDDLQIRHDLDVSANLHRADRRQVDELGCGATERVVLARLGHARRSSSTVLVT